MPRRNPPVGPRVLEGLVLQPRRVQVQLAPQGQQPLLIRAHEVSHRLTAQRVAMKPNAAVEGETHPIAAAREFPRRALYEQEM